MEILENLSFVNQIASDIMRPRNFAYTECPSCKRYNNQEYEKYSDRFQSIEVYDIRSKRRISTYICEEQSHCCIIYLHGLSSFSGEAKYLSEYTSGVGMSLCIFDFEGHGKSIGDYISYGINQKSNLCTKLFKLDSVMMQIIKRGHTDIILWGRSMGAVTSLLFMRDPTYFSISKRFVKVLILDSPFCSFTQVTQEIVSRRTQLPGFVTQMVIKLVRNHILKKHGIDLFTVDVSNCNNVKIPSVFVYSKEDQMVNWKHSDTIYNNYGGPKEIVEMRSGHNQQRQYECIKTIFRRIRSIINQNKGKDINRRGINIYSNREISGERLAACKSANESTEEEPPIHSAPKHRFLSNLAYL